MAGYVGGDIPLGSGGDECRHSLRDVGGLKCLAAVEDGAMVNIRCQVYIREINVAMLRRRNAVR